MISDKIILDRAHGIVRCHNETRHQPRLCDAGVAIDLVEYAEFGTDDSPEDRRQAEIEMRAKVLERFAQHLLTIGPWRCALVRHFHVPAPGRIRVSYQLHLHQMRDDVALDVGPEG